MRDSLVEFNFRPKFQANFGDNFVVKSLNQTKQKPELCTNEVFNKTSKKFLIKTIDGFLT